MRTVLVTNATLASLAADPAIRQQLPGLLGPIYLAAQQSRGCSSCHAADTSKLNAALASARHGLAGLTAGDRETLKRLLNADALQVQVASGGSVSPRTI